ncbi:MAG: dienelactone hydrolase family protein [Planctomycetes bacterium]|nr:dienelactone hydrolase family protein [Planctomycetota bacterium]
MNALLGLVWVSCGLWAPQQPTATRADLARSYQRFDKAYASAELTPERKRELNLAFDRSTMAFFMGQGAQVIADLERLSDSLGAPPPAAPPEEPAHDWDAARLALLAKLPGVSPENEPQRQALAAVRARIELLRNTLSPGDSAQFLVERPKLAAEVEAELALVVRGEDPYRRRTGDLWRVVALERGELPVHLYAPPAAAQDEPLPLLIALHGMGGDENMFFEGYGAGRLRALAEQRGFLLACPRANWLLSGATLERLIRALSYDYAIDEKRILLLGHSMGSGLAASIAARAPERFAGLACFAGGPGAKAEKLPPSWISVGALDPIANPDSLEKASKALTARGLTVRFERVPDLGHTLVVGERLGAAVEFLLGQQLP